MTRREFPRDVSVAIIKRAMRNGVPACERCGSSQSALEIHHKTMDALEVDKSRRLTAQEGELLCEPCHDPITSEQRTVLAKVKAVEARHLGMTTRDSSLKSKKRPEHEGRGPAVGLSEIARRWGVK